MSIFDQDNALIWERYNISYGDILLEKNKFFELTKMSVQQLSRKMEAIEKDNYDPEYNQEFDDLEDDADQDGFYGYGIFDDDSSNIQGYMYGYNFSEDEIDDISNIDPSTIKFYDEQFKKDMLVDSIQKFDLDNLSILDKVQLKFIQKKLIKRIRKQFTPSNTFYVANFVVNKKFRLGVKPLIQNVLKGVKTKGKQYIMMAALPDSHKLFSRPDGQLHTARLESFGIGVLATVHVDDQVMYLLKINQLNK